MSIPLEQGLRLITTDFVYLSCLFYEHSIRTRIKTNYYSLIDQNITYSMSIPLEQGLRLSPSTTRLYDSLFYEHSIRTRIKTKHYQ